MTEAQNAALQFAHEYAQKMLERAGASVWTNPEQIQQIADASIAMAMAITGTTIEIPEGTMPTSSILVPEVGGGVPMQIVLGSSSLSPTAANDLRKGTVDVDHKKFAWSPVSLASGSYRQAVKIDFGTLRAPMYAVWLCGEWAATPTAGNASTLWVAPSTSGTAGTGNPGGASGTDAAYTGYSSNAAASVLSIGNPAAIFTNTSQATSTKQIIFGGYYRPPTRYGCAIFLNNAGSAFHSSDAEIHIVFNPQYRQAQ